MQESIARSAERADLAMRNSVASWAASMTFVLLVPFLGYRLFIGDWTVSGVILAIMVAMAVVIVFLRAGGSAMVAVHVVVVVYSAGVVLVTYVLGDSGLLWLYPLMVANFYCLPRSSALTMNTVVVAAVAPELLADPYMGVRVLATLGLVFMFGWVFSRQLEQQRRQLAELGLTDTLTGTGNRRALDLALDQVLQASQRYGRPASLVILDLDRFKRINDRFGHRTGDEVLVRVAAYLQERLRRSDRAFRFGGEEFVVILPETPLGEAMKVADALRLGCRELEWLEIERLTLSAGVAQLDGDEGAPAWMQRADDALYRAKAEGRDRVVSAPVPPATSAAPGDGSKI